MIWVVILLLALLPVLLVLLLLLLLLVLATHPPQGTKAPVAALTGYKRLLFCPPSLPPPPVGTVNTALAAHWAGRVPTQANCWELQEEPGEHWMAHLA